MSHSEKDLINYTNERLANWYKSVKTNYGVDGTATAEIKGNEFIVNYVEDGVEAAWSSCYYVEYLKDLDIGYYFDNWSVLS